jgi:hypothetical protein
MSAGPLVVTYPLTGRSRAIVAEELGGTAEAIYLVDLAPAGRPATCRGNCRLPPIRAEEPNRCRSTSSRWRWLRRSTCSSSTSSAANSTSVKDCLLPLL